MTAWAVVLVSRVLLVRTHSDAGTPPAARCCLELRFACGYVDLVGMDDLATDAQVADELTELTMALIWSGRRIARDLLDQQDLGLVVL